jgi:hypothetical protein
MGMSLGIESNFVGGCLPANAHFAWFSWNFIMLKIVKGAKAFVSKKLKGKNRFYKIWWNFPFLIYFL